MLIEVASVSSPIRRSDPPLALTIKLALETKKTPSGLWRSEPASPPMNALNGGDRVGKTLN